MTSDSFVRETLVYQIDGRRLTLFTDRITCPCKTNSSAQPNMYWICLQFWNVITSIDYEYGRKYLLSVKISYLVKSLTRFLLYYQDYIFLLHQRMIIDQLIGCVEENILVYTSRHSSETPTRKFLFCYNGIFLHFSVNRVILAIGITGGNIILQVSFYVRIQIRYTAHK